jgi:hypothetical protein
MHDMQRAAKDQLRFNQHQEAELGLPRGSLVSDSACLRVTLALDGFCSAAERESLIADACRIPGALRGGTDVSVRPFGLPLPDRPSTENA